MNSVGQVSLLLPSQREVLTFGMADTSSCEVTQLCEPCEAVI